MSEQTTAEVVPEWDQPDRLRRALRHAGISSNEMAEYLEVTRHTISNWINGRTRPPATAVKLWSMRCGVPYEWVAHGIVREEWAARDSNSEPMDSSPVVSTAELKSEFLRSIGRPVEPSRRTGRPRLRAGAA